MCHMSVFKFKGIRGGKEGRAAFRLPSGLTSCRVLALQSCKPAFVFSDTVSPGPHELEEVGCHFPILQIRKLRLQVVIEATYRQCKILGEFGSGPTHYTPVTACGVYRGPLSSLYRTFFSASGGAFWSPAWHYAVAC